MQWSPECFCKKCGQCPHTCNKTICAWVGAPYGGNNNTVEFRKFEMLGEFSEYSHNDCCKISESVESVKKK